MMIYTDGLTTFGVTRSGGNSFPNGHLFTIPTADGAFPLIAGDLSVLFDVAINNTAAIPPDVIPAGWTSLGASVTGTTEAGNGVRARGSYKILTASDPGATFTGMNGTDNDRKSCLNFRMSRPVQSVAVAGLVTSGPQGGDPGSITILSANGVGNVLAVGFAHSQNSISDAQFVWTPDAIGTPHVSPTDLADNKGSASTTRGYFSYYPAGFPPASHAINMADLGIYNACLGCYLLLT